MTIVEVHDFSHMIIGRQKAFYVSMVGAHPELLQQVDVVLLLLNQFPDGLHPQRLVLGPKGRWHAPGVQGHELQADNGS